jgi:hypothetical protein
MSALLDQAQTAIAPQEPARTVCVLFNAINRQAQMVRHAPRRQFLQCLPQDIFIS